MPENVPAIDFVLENVPENEPAAHAVLEAEPAADVVPQNDPEGRSHRQCQSCSRNVKTVLGRSTPATFNGRTQVKEK